jgi:hypothetical protein
VDRSFPRLRVSYSKGTGDADRTRAPQEGSIARVLNTVMSEGQESVQDSANVSRMRKCRLRKWRRMQAKVGLLSLSSIVNII